MQTRIAARRSAARRGRVSCSPVLNRAGSRIYAEDTAQGLPKGVTGAYTLKQHAQNASKGEASPCHEPQGRAQAGGARRVVVCGLLAARAPGHGLFNP
jgi:hypothetical protein